VTHARRWLDTSTELFLGAVDALDEASWDRPTALPGWRPREIAAHVHLNAEALRNLVTWAASGVETPMYAGPEQRDADIVTTAELAPAELRQRVHRSAAALASDLDRLTDEAWQQQVVTAQGRKVPATEIVWMRTREVAIHAIDLGSGPGFDDLPPDLLEALVQDVIALRVRRGEAAMLAAWLTGRGAAGRDLGPWI
jgi:maleylpyruvate isomerase